MRLRDFLKATPLMSLALISVLAKPLPPVVDRPDYIEDASSGDPNERLRPVLPPAPALVLEDKVLESVYYNALAILSTNNRCSDFFGGPSASIEVFSRLMGQVRKDYYAPSVAMRMHGITVNTEDARTRARYRLFTKVSINANGAFYRRANFRSEQTVPGVGSFRPNTREVRLLILLHELGHMIRGLDGNWLLPDDGGNESLSRDNSRKIEKVCGDQIESPNEGEAIRNLARRNLAPRNQADETVALETNNSDQSVIERAGDH
jgi:hypothetical protein